MKITPNANWMWNYNGDKLGICMRTDEGRLVSLNTHYRINDLLRLPYSGQAFCCEDAVLLTTYEESLASIGLNETGCFDLGINAVACERFVKPSMPITRFFMTFENNFFYQNGSIVSIYTRSGNAADCLVLEECDIDGMAKLMLLNPSVEVVPGRAIALGKMIRVNPAALCSFRAFSCERHYRRYA